MSPTTRLSAPELVSQRRAPILIVDDNSSKRVALRAALEPLGYTLIEADSGAAGLRCVMAHDVAVILLDVRMPIMDGFETAALLRLRAETELTPIIFVTAYASDEIETDRYTAGAVDFLTAPVDPEELRAKVSALANLFLKAQTSDAQARDLRTTTHQLKRLTEDAPIGIFQTDTDNRYTYTNERWSEITGVSREAAAGAEWDVMLDDEQLAETPVAFDGVAAGTQLSSRVRISTGAGRPGRFAVLTARPVADAGRPSGWVGTLTDITAEVEAEVVLVEARDRATEAAELKSDFLANMSHEIRTPMTGIIGWTEVLLDTELDGDQRSCVQALSRAGEAMMNVINAVLDFSKLEAGMLEVEHTEFSLRTVVDEVVEVLSRAADGQGLELTSVVDPSLPATVMGDANRVRQVLTNLTGNAIKFTETGQVTIRVVLLGDEGTENGVRFEVADTGVGIAEDKLAMIFDRFTQADTSVTRGYGGTGLGLAISNRLTGLMGGHIGVSSEVGRGSTFWFTVNEPRAEAEAEAEAETAAVAPD